MSDMDYSDDDADEDDFVRPEHVIEILRLERQAYHAAVSRLLQRLEEELREHGGCGLANPVKGRV